MPSASANILVVLVVIAASDFPRDAEKVAEFGGLVNREFAEFSHAGAAQVDTDQTILYQMVIFFAQRKSER